MGMEHFACVAWLSVAICLCANDLRTNAHGDFDVRHYGATGDGVTKDTKAVRDAFYYCSTFGGGIVIFPKQPVREHTVYLTGAFNITENTTVRIDPGVTVLASNDSEDFPLIQPLPWYGGGSDKQQSGDLNYQPFVHALRTNNIELTGGGNIDGNGAAWWNCWRHDRKAEPCNGYSRPHLVNLVGGENIMIHNLELRNSPSWTLHLSNSTSIHVQNMTIINPEDAPNADGIDIDCCQNVLVENSLLDVGDDVLCVKSGIDWFGRTYGHPSANIVFRNIEAYHGHGITIGSEMSAGVHNVLFENIRMDGTANGIRMKSQRGRGGVVEDIMYRNISMKNIGTSVSITLNYHQGLKPTNKTATPIFRNITIQHIVSDKPSVGYFLDGLPESHVTGLTLDEVKITNAKKMVERCDYTEGDCTNSEPCPPCIKSATVQHVQNAF